MVQASLKVDTIVALSINTVLATLNLPKHKVYTYDHLKSNLKPTVQVDLHSFKILINYLSSNASVFST